MGEKNFMDLYWKQAIENGWIRGPRLLISCQLLVKTGGHGWFLGCEVDGPDGLRTAVRQQVKAGADWIKFMLTGGASTKGSDPLAPEYTAGEIRAVIEEAHHCGRKVAAHAHGGPGVKTAVECGLDSLEHGTFLTEDDLRLMADQGTFLVITMGVKLAAAKSKVVPRFFKEKAARGAKHYLETIRLAKKHGVKIAFGSDTLHADPKTELETLVKAGFSAEEALKIGTIQAAELLDLDTKIGSVETGKVADLIAVNGAPHAKVNDVANVVAVMKGGEIVR
jgi:imidazolonepropionase-like amidohydrolase